MATYIIGDVHGCFATLSRLLEKIEYDRSADRILMTGDLVNGGPGSAAVVRWAREQEAEVVLGNHDLHLLAVAAGGRGLREKDTFADLLQADDRDDLLDWLRNRPLVICEEDFLLVHAGLMPEWDASTAVELAGEVQQALRAGGDAEFFRAMYGNEPRRWSDNLAGMDRTRVIVNAMTRIRMVTAENEIVADYSGPPDPAPAGLRPWFSVAERATAGKHLYFGHWAALGFYAGSMVIGLDSGCAWGGALTALRLDDGRAFQVRSELARKNF